MRTFVWNISEQKVSKNTVRRSMRKTLKNDPKNQSKTHQKTSKNAPKKHTEQKKHPISTKGGRSVTKTRPTREGKGGIQDGILLEKKKNIAKTRPTAGKGCMREGNTQDRYPISTRSAGGLRPARGRISVACGNSSAPGPREESVRTERLQSNKKGCKMSKFHQKSPK